MGEINIDKYVSDAETIAKLNKRIRTLENRIRRLNSMVPRWVSLHDKAPKQYKDVLVYVCDEYNVMHYCEKFGEKMWEHELYNAEPTGSYWMKLPPKPRALRRRLRSSDKLDEV